MTAKPNDTIFDLPAKLKSPKVVEETGKVDSHLPDLNNVLEDEEQKMSNMREGHTPLMLALIKEDTSKIAILLENGARLNYEARHDGENMVELFLKLGASSTHISLNNLPEEILEKILLKLKPTFLISVCSRVCQMWNRTLNKKSFWFRFYKDNCKEMSITYLLDTLLEIQRLCVKKPLKRNLIVNPQADDDYNGWSLVQSGGNGFAIEGTNLRGTHTVSNTSIKGCTNCWVSSYDWCAKEQTIDLLAEGFTEIILDKNALKISVSECVATGGDTISEYYFELTLQDKDKEPLGRTLRKEYNGKNTEWKKVEECRSYWTPGLRYLKFKHGGKGTCEGHNGSKFTSASVKINSVQSSPFAKVLKQLIENFH